MDERVRLFAQLAGLTDGRSDEITRTIVSEVGQPATTAAKSHTAAAVRDLEIIAESLCDVA